MRAREFIQETKAAKIPTRYKDSSVGVNIFSDKERWNADYVSYRLGMALAASNGVDPLDLPGKSWIGKFKTTNPYTKVEQDMLNQCYKIVGADAVDVNQGDIKSHELEDTNTHSPVAQNPWNKKTKKVAEAATTGATSSANNATVPNPHLSPGTARGKKSYIGSPGKSGTKSPPQPKPKQPKTASGTAVNALNMKGTSIFGGPLRRT